MTAADPFDFPLLQHAQQRDLRLGGQVADFIEEHGAAVGGFEPSQASLQRAREGALFVSEELGRNEGLWYGRAVHPYERLRRPSRPLVNSARDELLAGTGFAKEEDRRIGRGDLRHLDQHRSQRCGRAHDLFKHRGAIDVFAQREILALRPLFGPLAIVDVHGRGVPAEHPALVVDQWTITHQEPAVLPIVAPGAPLDFEGHSVRQSLTPGILEPGDILGMEEQTGEIGGQQIGHRESGVVEDGTIGVQGDAVGGQDDDGLSDGIEDLSQFEGGGAHQIRYTQRWRTRKTGAPSLRISDMMSTSTLELAEILDAIAESIVVLTPDGVTLYANRAVLDYTGLTMPDLLAADFPSLLFHPEDVARLKDTRRERLSHGVPFEIEWRARRHDGQYRWFLVRYRPLVDDQSRVLRWYATAMDIDDRKRTEERTQSENLALREDIDRASMFEEIVGSSASLRAVLVQVAKAAPTDSTVLLLAETGTGKELIARAI